MPSKELLQYDPQTIIRDTNIFALFNIWKNNANASDIWNVYDKVEKLRLFLVRLYKSGYFSLVYSMSIKSSSE